ncbi:deoxyribodipyrimidine photolyase [Mesorhizobium loti NZP2037]|nr:deoxyribodipyrimidine photolyase [Mesorhizobium loti NZP2037]
MVKTLVLILGDQLSHDISSLRGFDLESDVILMAEVEQETTYVRHHKQKIAFILSSMRHYADELRERNFLVDYSRLDDPENCGSFTGELMRAVARHQPDRVVVTEPGEWRVRAMMDSWHERLNLPVEIREDKRFLCSLAEFSSWAGDRKTYRMEFFYREMRRRTGILMDGKFPCGGQWNFDAANRKRFSRKLSPPDRLCSEPDTITREVLDLVAARFGDHFGDLQGFSWAVTRKKALAELDRFVSEALPFFGDYQDAMASDEPFLFHALIAPYLNIGLLCPREVCEAAERTFRHGRAKINAVEGFIRQILGWREYVRGIYWLRMPHYSNTNALGADRPLPWFYWSGETQMNCMATTIADTRRSAYAHHIQRLMITGNFALLMGVRPAEIEEWYLAVYADAFEWVELPNTHGMVLYADGGLLASKPYAASGAYIDRMSDYCDTCAYSPKIKVGARACPFNFLYWNFLIEKRSFLEQNARMTMPYRTLDRMSQDHKIAITQQAREFIGRL